MTKSRISLLVGSLGGKSKGPSSSYIMSFLCLLSLWPNSWHFPISVGNVCSFCRRAVGLCSQLVFRAGSFVPWSKTKETSLLGQSTQQVGHGNQAARRWPSGIGFCGTCFYRRIRRCLRGNSISCVQHAVCSWRISTGQLGINAERPNQAHGWSLVWPICTLDS